MLIHIGYHKTGTTSLQSSNFSSSKAGFSSPWRRDQIVRWVVMPDPFIFDTDAARAFFSPGLESARVDGLLPVLSHERLSGYPASGGFDSAEIARRLADVFPDAKVLITIREQKSLLKSWYAQYVLDGGALPFDAYAGSFPPRTAYRSPLFRFEFYEFDRLISFYKNLFPRENVLVLPFELLARDASKFLGHVRAHVGLDPHGLESLPTRNTAMPPSTVALRRMAHRLFYANQLNTLPMISAKSLRKVAYKLADIITRTMPRAVEQRIERRLRNKVDAAVGDRYRESNRRTADLIGLDLNEFGYDCTGSKSL